MRDESTYATVTVVPRRVVWMKPTEFSPACLFTFTPKAVKALSACKMWITSYAKDRVIDSHNRGETCPHCEHGREVTGDLSDVPARRTT
jgi:hypothetical protein